MRNVIIIDMEEKLSLVASFYPLLANLQGVDNYNNKVADNFNYHSGDKYWKQLGLESLNGNLC